MIKISIRVDNWDLLPFIWQLEAAQLEADRDTSVFHGHQLPDPVFH